MVKPEPIKVPTPIPQINEGPFTLEALSMYENSFKRLKEEMLERSPVTIQESIHAEGAHNSGPAGQAGQGGDSLLTDNKLEWIYRFSDSFMKKVEGCHLVRSIEVQFKLLHQPNALLRSDVVTFMKHLNSSNEEGGCQLLIEGKQGCGKSTAMLQLASILEAEQKRIVLYLPDGKKPNVFQVNFHFFLFSLSIC